jgi:hypothetical protein
MESQIRQNREVLGGFQLSMKAFCTGLPGAM